MLNKKAIEQIEKALGYVFVNKQLLIQAFTRSSFHSEHPEARDNEILEWSGDSVLSLIVVNLLSDKYMVVDENGIHSCKNEGELSALKSALVNKQYLSKRMSELCLQDYMFMSVGDRQQGIQNSKSVLEDLFESIVGAIYIDSGRDLNKTGEAVKHLLDVDAFLNLNNNKVHVSFKNDLQELCQKHSLGLPAYITENYNSEFQSFCCITDAFVQTSGFGLNKKMAEEAAAQKAIAELQEFLNYQPKPITVIDAFDVINALQEHCQKNGLPLPVYDTVKDEVDSNNTHTFTVVCNLNGVSTHGEGKNKKDAKKQAAYNMLVKLGLIS